MRVTILHAAFMGRRRGQEGLGASPSARHKDNQRDRGSPSAAPAPLAQILLAACTPRSRRWAGLQQQLQPQPKREKENDRETWTFTAASPTKSLPIIEGGNLTWLQPWQAGGHKAGAITRPLRAGGIPYRGVNVLMLWASAMEKGYSCPLWLTYKQAAELGGQVRKGEKGSLVVYANTFTKTGTDEQGAEVETEIPFMKGYTVFNAEQIDGLPAHFYATVPPLNNDITRLESAERFFASTKATIQHGGNQGVLQPRPRHRANAGVANVPRRRKLLRHPRA